MKFEALCPAVRESSAKHALGNKVKEDYILQNELFSPLYINTVHTNNQVPS